MNNWVGGELPQSFCLPLWLRTIRGRSLLGRSGLYKNRKADLDGSASVCWSTRIRTWNDRTRICSVTITPYSKVASTVSFSICAAKVRTFLEPPNVFSIFFAKNAIFLQKGVIFLRGISAGRYKSSQIHSSQFYFGGGSLSEN